MDSAELKRLAAEVSVQHGIRVDPDDPIMAVVTLNRLAIETTVAESLSSLQKTAQDLRDAAERVQVRAGAVLGQEVRDSVSILKTEIHSDIDKARIRAAELIDQLHRAQSKTRRWLWSAIGLAAGAFLFLSGVEVGMLLR
jgi:hypothetical protein